MKSLTAERLREVLRYDPVTGVFVWLVDKTNKTRTGGLAGDGKTADRYIRIMIDGHRYLAHRLAWLYVTGAWPVAQIDHANGASRDNRYANLREATQQQNCGNRKKTAGRPLPKGTRAKYHKFEASIRGRYLGMFRTADEAGAAYADAAKRAYGEFARTT